VPGVIGGAIGDIMKISKDAAKDAFSAAILRNKMPIVAKAMIDISAGSPTIDGIKDLTKWSLRSGAVVGTTKIQWPTPPAFKAFPTDPLQWQNNVNLRVQTELSWVTQLIEIWQNIVNTGTENTVMRFINFNPVDIVRDSMRITSILRDSMRNNSDQLGNAPDKLAIEDNITSIQPIEMPEVSKLFQVGLLCTWINKYYYNAIVQNSSFGRLSTFNAFGNFGPYGEIVNYGQSLGMTNVEDILSKASDDGYNAYWTKERKQDQANWGRSMY
jgi:hypothetical protein